MLVSFSVCNYRTFRERATWSLLASADKTREDDNVVELPDFGLRLLKSAVVYGANASGKSKLVEAFEYMRRFVINSSKDKQAGEPTKTIPFKLNPSSELTPSEFEIQFVHENEFYRYGFEVSSALVESEWLFMRTAKNVRSKPEVELFYRTKQDITIHPRRFGGIVNELIKNSAVRDNALLLSVAAQFNQPRATTILGWFTYSLLILSGSDESIEKAFSFFQLRSPTGKLQILSFLTNADLNIEDVREGEQPPFSLLFEDEVIDAANANKLRRWSNKEHADLTTLHRAYNDSRDATELVSFSLTQDESAGTQRMLTLAGPVLGTLALGSVLIIDEMDARLHPNLVAKIVQLFNSKTTNPKNAQLLSNTHDTNLLTSGNFRRDQIWFTEKNRYGEATLYSLADFKTDKVRKDEDFEANYVRGKYGAVPYLGDFGALPQTDAATEPVHEHEA